MTYTQLFFLYDKYVVWYNINMLEFLILVVGIVGWILFLSTFFVQPKKSITKVINKIKSQKATIVDMSEIDVNEEIK